MQRKTILQTGLDEIIRAQQAQLNAYIQEREQITGGKLTLKHANGNEFYYENHGMKRQGITKDKDRVYQLARARYLDIKIEELNRELAIAQDALLKQQSKSTGKFQRFLNRFTPESIDILRVLCSQRQYEYATRQSMNPGFRDNLRYEMPDGRLTRNISERDIGKLLIEKLIPFHYECELIIDVTDIDGISYDFMRHGRKYKKFYPDFIIPFADGSIFIWEHLGFITDEGYRFKQGVKLIAYLNGEIVDIKQLFYSFPKDLKDFKYLNHIIDTRIAPFV